MLHKADVLVAERAPSKGEQALQQGTITTPTRKLMKTATSKDQDIPANVTDLTKTFC